MKNPTYHVIRTVILVATVVLLIVSSAVYIFHAREVSRKSKAANEWALYWGIMERSLAYERQGQYAKAVAGYRSAIPYAENLPPDLVQRAKIAIYNRIGACYVKMGELGKAIEAFRESARTGDTKYAPKKISEITRQVQER